MPVVCIARPNRSRDRPYTERDAARIICRVLSSGGSLKEIEAQRLTICGDVRPKDVAVEAALAQAEQALEDSNTTFELTLAFFALLTGLFTLLRAIGRTPATFPVRIAATQAIVEVGVVTSAITVRMAANAGTMAIVRQAAANASRFAVRAAA